MNKKQTPTNEAIGRAADELTNQLRRAERILQEKNYCAFGAVVLESDGVHELTLQFGKDILAGEWKLHLSYGAANDPETWKSQSLFSASLQKRMLAARAIPELVKVLEFESELQQKADGSGAAAAELDAYLETLKLK